MISILAIGLFACKDPNSGVALDKETLARQAVDTVIPGGENNARITTALLSLLSDAGLEEAETSAVLLALMRDETPSKYEYALIDVAAGVMRAEHTSSYRAALTTVASAVSPELAGAIYYAAAKKENADLPYTLEDCRKLASLILSQSAAFNVDLLEDVTQTGTLRMSEKEASTAILSLAASLRKAVGITQGAKNYLYDLANAKIDELSVDEETATEEEREAMLRVRTLLRSLAAGLRDHYDLVLTYAAEYFSAGDARILLGQTYEQKESTVYYGYRDADWSSVEISEEDYLARRGGYDRYLERRVNRNGVSVNGTFLPISDEDAELTDRIYRLNVAYKAYNALSAADKTAFSAALPELMAILSENQGVVADLVGRPIIEDSGAPAASLSDLLAALPAALRYDVSDGISAEERTAAKSVIAVFESYLHGYLPRVY